MSRLMGMHWYYWLWAGLLVAALIMRFTAGGRKVAKKIGDFNARFILTIIYVLVLWPFGFMVRLFSDPLRIKKLPTQWLEHPEEAMDMQWAKRQ
jgi:hypothetical protein